MNMPVGGLLNRVLLNVSNEASDAFLPQQSGTRANQANSISFGSPATSNLPELTKSAQENTSSAGNASFNQFMQQIGRLLQTALSAIDSLAQQVSKAHTSPDSAKTTSNSIAAPAQMATASATADGNNTADVAAASAADGSKSVSGNSALDPARNSLTFENKGDKPLTIAFTPNADGSAKPDDLTLEPGETKTQNFDANWSGNFRSTAGDGANATLGEVKFDGGSGQTYYDVSYIEGNNAAMTIGPAKGDGRVSGTLDDLVANAPDSIKAKDADGNVYGLKKSTTANQQDPAVVDYYRQHVAADKGYVIPSDDASTLGSSSKNLKVELKG
ncbi:hypothetical protein [Erwinia sp. CGal63]|uniref:hypothetical protein n=1 Tax=Erwinia sp. CGal63 TaxID=2919889 RepID=UPI0030083895